MGRTSIDPRWKAFKADGSPFPGEEHPAMVTLKTGKPQFDVMMGIQKPDDELSWILVNSQLLVNPNTNEPYAVYAVFKDITELTKAHEQQTHLIDLIKKQNQQLTEYAYITSHNLRSPIANLISLCQLLEEDNKPEVYTPMIAESASQLDSTMKIMNRLLDIDYNVSQSKKEPVNLKYITNHNISLLKHLITKPLTLSVEIDENLEFESIPTYINSIVNNMLSNALKFRKFGDNDFIQIKANKTKENTLELSFEDNGIGIDLEKNRDKLFKLKSRLHSSKDGKGIGLFFTKHQIEALNGEIQIESEVGKGTKFLIIFKE
jgi:signal transduction histidine kinase